MGEQLTGSSIRLAVQKLRLVNVPNPSIYVLPGVINYTWEEATVDRAWIKQLEKEWFNEH